MVIILLTSERSRFGSWIEGKQGYPLTAVLLSTQKWMGTCCHSVAVYHFLVVGKAMVQWSVQCKNLVKGRVMLQKKEHGKINFIGEFLKIP